MISLLNGNSLHIPLADKSVQCVITSPPYFGLRDYGTAQWEGGDPACNHSPADTPQRRGIASSTLGGGKETTGHQREGYVICPHCGAVRVDQQIGLESTPAEYVAHIVAVMRECWRVLRDDGVMFLNLGDSYAGQNNGYSGDNRPSNQSGSLSSKNGGQTGNGQRRRLGDGLKPKDLCGIPWRCAFALQEDGWTLRSDIIWSKPNPMPESVTDRPTKAHEYVFLLTKRARYYYDAEAIKEPSEYPDDDRKLRSDVDDKRMPTDMIGGIRPGSATYSTRNKRSVWEIATSPYSGAHYATFPPDLVRPMVLAGTSPRACEICGAPWERVTEKGLTAHDGNTKTTYPDGSTAKRMSLLRQAARERGYEYTNEKKTTGWRPTCRCAVNTGSARCVILDPFCGSGTVLEVAREAGRDAIGIDLSLKYLTDNAMPRALNTNTQSSMATLPMFAMMGDA